MITARTLDRQALMWREIVGDPPSRAQAALALGARALEKASDDRERDEGSEALRVEFVSLAGLLRGIADEIPIEYMGRWACGGHRRAPDIRLVAIARFSEIISLSARALDLATIRTWTVREIQRAAAVAMLEQYMATLPRTPRPRYCDPGDPLVVDRQVMLLRSEVADLRGAHDRVDQVWDEIDDLPRLRQKISQARAELAELGDVRSRLGKLRDMSAEQRDLGARIARLEQAADDPTRGHG